MNRWKIPDWLEQEVLARDTACVYCGISFSLPALSRGSRPSWEHIINDARIISRENIARCCTSCNSSKKAKTLQAWLQSDYCKRKGIGEETVAEVVRSAFTSLEPTAGVLTPRSTRTADADVKILAAAGGAGHAVTERLKS